MINQNALIAYLEYIACLLFKSPKVKYIVQYLAVSHSAAMLLNCAVQVYAAPPFPSFTTQRKVCSCATEERLFFLPVHPLITAQHNERVHHQVILSVSLLPE